MNILPLQLYAIFSQRKGYEINEEYLWEDLASTSEFLGPFIVVGEDLNFYLGFWEVLDPSPHPNPQNSFFLYFISQNKLMDVKPIMIMPT